MPTSCRVQIYFQDLSLLNQNYASEAAKFLFWSLRAIWPWYLAARQTSTANISWTALISNAQQTLPESSRKAIADAICEVLTDFEQKVLLRRYGQRFREEIALEGNWGTVSSYFGKRLRCARIKLADKESAERSDAWKDDSGVSENIQVYKVMLRKRCLKSAERKQKSTRNYRYQMV